MSTSAFFRRNSISPPLAGWRGGKSRLAKYIVEKIPNHTCYVEPFAGAAWVLFCKSKSKVEVINDINEDVINLYRCIDVSFEEFINSFNFKLISRAEFNRLKDMDIRDLSDIERAVRFYYLHHTSFGGARSLTFGYRKSYPPALNLSKLKESILKAHARLCRAFIECLPYTEVIRRYDGKDTFFYIDPPYWDHENDYGKGIFSKEDFAILAKQLTSIKGKFLLSINDCEKIREIFKCFTIELVQTRYTVGTLDGKSFRKELFVKNY